eukprot:TRINITY_DN47670_c0_g1_i1.p2 TRINITY_DN47670_c0_g1~~TRINITY_DN47670_c0_g1_i1.p2  ORF type:complete len:371 (+),score=109.76 TRINITY_DN47670_c0_g1_i1:44-1114(+)
MPRPALLFLLWAAALGLAAAAEPGTEREADEQADEHVHSDHRHAAGGGGGGGISIQALRVLAMVSIAGIKVAFAFAPLRFRTNPGLLAVANSFAAGVFLAGGFAHLLPEAVEAFGSLGEGQHEAHEGHHHHEHHHHGAPVPYVLSAGGFLLTFYLEKVFLRPDNGAHHHDPEEGRPAPHGHDHSHGLLTALGASHAQGKEPAIGPLVLALVLSVHSVVAGMALGVQTDPAKAMLVLLAIVAHKWVEAFSLGVSIVRAGVQPSAMMRLVFGFACSSPLGILLGWALRSATQGPTAAAATAVLDAAASGTFIYIAVVDTLQEEFAHNGGRRADAQRKFASVCVGFVLMLYLGTVAHEH